MARRQTAVLRNLDDPLRVLGLLSLRSCGLVLFLFAALHVGRRLRDVADAQVDSKVAQHVTQVVPVQE